MFFGLSFGLSLSHPPDVVQSVRRASGWANLRRHGLEKGWTQEELAWRAGLNRTHLYRLEKGLQSMTLVTLKTIADTLEVRVVQLLKGGSRGGIRSAGAVAHPSV